MARIRSIRPGIWANEQFVLCSFQARLLFLGMYNFCDDSGVIQASLLSLKIRIMPAENFQLEEIRGMIQELLKNNLIEEYESNGSQYWSIRGWSDQTSDFHQRIDKPNPKLPKNEKSEKNKTEKKLTSAKKTKTSKTPVNIDDNHSNNVQRMFQERSKNVPAQIGEDRIGADRIGEDITEYSSELLHTSEPENHQVEQVLISIPLNDKTEFQIGEAFVDEMKNLFQAVDVMAELRKMKGWCLAHPERRKTKRGVKKFIVGWLTREQDRRGAFKTTFQRPATYAYQHPQKASLEENFRTGMEALGVVEAIPEDFINGEVIQ